MTNTLEYGRRRSRRHWRALAVALVIGVAAFFAVRAWREYRARLEDQRLQAQQRAYRQDFDRQFQRQFGPASSHAATRP